MLCVGCARGPPSSCATPVRKKPCVSVICQCTRPRALAHACLCVCVFCGCAYGRLCAVPAVRTTITPTISACCVRARSCECFWSQSVRPHCAGGCPYGCALVALAPITRVRWCVCSYTYSVCACFACACAYIVGCLSRVQMAHDIRTQRVSNIKWRRSSQSNQRSSSHIRRHL